VAGDNRGNIVIIGGGVAGLSAAFELTKPGRYPGESVTIYQAGWRLGGKCATGRDEQRRVVEHGPHLWFGYYENAFQLLREVYDELPDAPRRFAAWNDAFHPLPFTQIGEPRLAESGGLIPFVWPRRAGSPGDGRRPSFPDAVAGLLGLLAQFHDALAEVGVRPTLRISSPPAHALAFDRLFGLRGGLSGLTPEEAVRSAARWWSGIGGDPADPLHLAGVTGLLRDAADAVRRHVRELPEPGPGDTLLAETTDIAAAFMGGLVDEVVLGRAPREELDENDLRDWLVDNGAEAEGVERSPFLRALYTTMFQYVEGETSLPNYGAGTAAQVVLRMLGTYKGAAVWKPNAGLGEALISPLYQALVARGVRFAFFHKLERVELSADGGAVARLHFARQAEVAQDFKPTFEFDGLTCWPDSPPGGLAKPEKPEDDFESRWCTRKVKPDLVLNQGEHFDEAILAIAGGAFKSLGRDLGPCAELIKANPHFRVMAEEIGLVPSLSAQVWCRKTLADLGWPETTAALVGGPPPLSIWTDMTQLLDVEDWGEDAPKSLHYFCNVFASSDYRDPAAVGDAVERAQAQTVDWFERNAAQFWPKAVNHGAEGETDFDWDVLEDPQNRKGSERLKSQIVKANVDPWACCCGSAAGSTGWRLRTDESGFRHLYLAGSWIDTGLNTECIEAAVMSGKQASRALCGAPAHVAGESFLRGRSAPATGAAR
jgi:uncharacterized protein with NAD-binding domain and iron-sulfur cluster